jgi:molybdopterin synthase sulfur carrier subunit
MNGIPVKLRYFAILREMAQKSDEMRSTSASTVGQLYDELREIYPRFLPSDHVRVAINNRFVAMNSALRADDEVVFIPPVAGG